MLAAMDDVAKSLNICQITLVSTKTAIKFYENQGLRSIEEPFMSFGILGYPMSKLL